jgi:hypothetical protein
MRLHELISKVGANSDGDGDFDRLFAFGARSFSIRNTDAQLVFDSGYAIERTIARHLPAHFNSTNISNTSFDERSVHKGPESEGLVVGTAGDLGPEGILFIAADKAPGGKPLLLTCNEISGTTTIWELRATPPAGLPTR